MASYPLASLYVGDLHPDVNEAMLYERFSPAGAIVSIRVCRDMMTKRSLGYAYVNFTNHQDAERALDTLNFEPINGHPCRIMWSQRDPGLRKSGFGNIFIKNLDKAIDNKALFDTFSAFGNILSCKVATDETGESRGFGYVHFEKQEDAERSIDKVNGMSLNEKIVFVGTFISKKERQATGQGRIIFNNLYVKNFGSEWTEQQFHELFSQYGEILSIKIMKSENGIGQGFGFCSFTKAESAMDAQEQLHQKHQIPTGEILYVQRAQRRREREGELKRKFEIVKQQKRQETKGVNLFVKNLEDEITDELLRTHFVPYGNITSCKVMRDETGHSKGFGFVCYATPEEATKAVTELNGKIIITKPLYVAIAQRKEERRALLTQQFVNRQMTHISRQNPQHLASGMMPAAATLMPYGPNFSANIPRAYNPALRLPAPGNLRGGTNVAAGVPAGGAYGQSLQQMTGARMGEMRGAVGRGRQTQNQQPRQSPGPRMKYTPNAGAPRPNMHPMSMMLHQQQMMQGPPQQPKDMSTKPINITHLTSADPKQQKQILGETLFPIIYRKYPQQAGKITGMLLELEISELLFLLDSGEQLNAKMEEAYEVLQKHQVNVPGVPQ
eukprot:TRINITY_DN1186_c0_g1_i1.p1 TRINITY_DN1186_c0_g1~~TRINITY_DN1186_c0_g1_i1.p1  ORF type:complete len:612 (-),score=152.71 TRINITY_DN1186_c0_g1_i1:93-1928(-)